jgi:hypothetical protein
MSSTPNVSSGEVKTIASFTPAKFDALIKILSLFDKSNESIKISESTIIQPFQSAVAIADCSQLFDEQEVTLEIVQPKKYIKLLKNFRNNDNINIIDDGENNRYVITNNEIKLFLPKKAEVTTDDDDLLPNFEGSQVTYGINIDKETAKQLSGLSNDSEYIEYLIQDNQLKGIHIPDTAIYLFANFLKDAEAKKLDETNADVMLKTGVFLSIPADDYGIEIGQLKDGRYFSITNCNTGLIQVSVKVIEILEETTGGNLLI